MRDKKLLGILAIILSGFTARSDVVFARALMEEFPVLFVLGLGQAVALFICFFYLGIRHRIKDFWGFCRKNLSHVWVNSALAGILAPMAFLIAIKFSSAVNASLFVAFTPVFTTVLAYFFLKERDLTWQFFGGAIFMLLGVIVVVTQGFQAKFSFSFFDLFALLASFLYASAHVLTKKYISLKHLDYVVISRLLATVVFLAVVIGLIFVPGGEISMTEIIPSRFHILGFALVSVMATYLLFYYGISVISAHEASTLLLFGPLAGVMYSGIFLGEKLTGVHYFGGVLIVGGMLIVNFHLRKAKKELLEYKMRTRTHDS